MKWDRSEASKFVWYPNTTRLQAFCFKLHGPFILDIFSSIISVFIVDPDMPCVQIMGNPQSPGTGQLIAQLNCFIIGCLFVKICVQIWKTQQANLQVPVQVVGKHFFRDARPVDEKKPTKNTTAWYGWFHTFMLFMRPHRDTSYILKTYALNSRHETVNLPEIIFLWPLVNRQLAQYHKTPDFLLAFCVWFPVHIGKINKEVNLRLNKSLKQRGEYVTRPRPPTTGSSTILVLLRPHLH